MLQMVIDMLGLLGQLGQLGPLGPLGQLALKLDELINEGHVPFPTQWIETDKNAHKKVEAQKQRKRHVPEMKSRLVGCGQFEDTTGIRSDSPTADVEGLNLVASFAACEKLLLRCNDLKNAYFKAGQVDRLMLMF